MHFPEPNRIHLWCANLKRFSQAMPLLQAMLSPVERARAVKFKFPQDRDYFVIRRGLLRWLLSQYLPVPPTQHEFVRGEFGKPGLLVSRKTTSIQFNFSHSAGMAVYAITGGIEIGVDIERIRLMDDIEDIVEIFFTKGESATLRALPAGRKLEAFYNCWTRKEAILKATGEGIARGVNRVEVTLAPSEPAQVLKAPGVGHAGLAWTVHSFKPATGYIAALAYQGSKLGLERRRLTPEFCLLENSPARKENQPYKRI